MKQHLLKESKSQGGGWRAYTAQDWQAADSGLGKKSTLVKIRERLSFGLNFNTDVLCEVVVSFLSINPAHHLSLILIQRSDWLNPTIKQINKVGITYLDV